MSADVKRQVGTGREALIAVPILLCLGLPALFLLPATIAAQTAVRLFIVLLVLMAAIDIATLKVPNLLIYPSILFALSATLLLRGDLFLDALLGGFGLLGLLFVVALIGRGAMGMGDVKVGCFTGCCLGLTNGFLSLLVGFLVGGAFALMVLLLRLRERKDVVPLTPFIAGAAVVYGLYVNFLLGSPV